MSGSTGSIYSDLSSYREARYQSYIATWKTRLTAVQAQITQLLANPVESYSFSAGDGSNQQTSRRKLQTLTEEEDRLISRIEKYARLLYGGGVISLDLRRK